MMRYQPPSLSWHCTALLSQNLEKEHNVAKEGSLSDAPPVEPNPAGDGAQKQLRLDESKLIAAYANFCRVTGTPEELIIDFGLNTQPMGIPDEPVIVNQRIVTNFFTAKRLLHALQLTLQRHEAAFGVLETDVNKRVVPSARPAAR
jgi:hypothetical protein